MIYTLNLGVDIGYKRKHRCRLREIIVVPGIGKVQLASVHPPFAAHSIWPDKGEISLIGLQGHLPITVFRLPFDVGIGVPQEGCSWEEGPYDYLARGELTLF